MTEFPDRTDTPSLSDVVLHLSHALDVFDRLIGSHEAQTAKDQLVLLRMIRMLCRLSRLPPEKRAKKIAGLMRRITFLCRLDELRNRPQSLQGDFVLLNAEQQVPSSDVLYWRQEFYADMAAVLTLDQEFFCKISPETSFSGNE